MEYKLDELFILYGSAWLSVLNARYGNKNIT